MHVAIRPKGAAFCAVCLLVTFITLLMIGLWIITFGTDADDEIAAWINRRSKA